MEQWAKLDEEREPARNGKVPRRNRNDAPWASAVSGVIKDESRKVEAKPKFRVHKPEPEPLPPPKSDDLFDGIVLDEALLSTMMANLASHGMSIDDL